MEEITNNDEKEILKQKRIANTIAEELNVKPIQVEKTIELIDGGNTIPFIARYRKEVTGGLSDETLRDLGERFNKVYGKTFELPEYQIPKIGAKIMNLQNPEVKMSKSAPKNDKGTIFILDDVEITKKKIMSAVTDNEGKIYFDPERKPGISNLLSIMAVIDNLSIEEVSDKYKDYTFTDRVYLYSLVLGVLEKIVFNNFSIGIGGGLLIPIAGLGTSNNIEYDNSYEKRIKNIKEQIDGR